jgi:hypothetical protein
VLFKIVQSKKSSKKLANVDGEILPIDIHITWWKDCLPTFFFMISGSSLVVAHMMVTGGLYGR